MSMKPKIVDGEPVFEHACDDCQPQHTPTPWKVSQTGIFVMHSRPGTVLNVCEASKEDAAFIVRAVNSHEKMLKALKSVFLPDVSAKARDLIVKAIAKAEEL